MSHKLQIKQVDLSRVAKDESKVRFLVIDVDGNVYWNDSPGGLSLTYTNAEPVPVTLGGVVAGQTFNNVSMQDMWTNLLYPYQTPAFTSFSVSGTSPLEVGESLPATLTFSWQTDHDANVNPNSIVISDVPIGTLLSGLPSDGSSSYTYAIPVKRTTTGSYQWTITGYNTHGGTYVAHASKNWYWRVFWGTSASTAMPIESFIEGLLNTPLKSSRVGVYQFLGNDYKYLAIPNSYGVPTSIIYNGLPFALADSTDGYMLGSGNITYTQVSIQNANLQTETYNVFRSKNPLVGAVSMTVS